MLPTKFNITYIPIWLENTMARTGMNFSDVLNKEKLLNILSKNDIVFYLLANKLFQTIYLDETILADDFFKTENVTNLFNSEKDIIQNLNIECSTIYSRNNLYKESMFLQHTLGEVIDMNVFKDKKFTFICQLIDDSNIIVRFKFLDEEIPSYKFLGNFYEQLLRTINYYYPFHEIARTKLFEKYCQYVGNSINQ